MLARIPRFLLLFTALLIGASSLYCQSASNPVSKTELLALVAGNDLSENIVREVQTRGLSFRADDSFKAQLSSAGADANLQAAVVSAKVMRADKADSESEIALQNHISAAGRMMRAKQYEGATRELTAVLQNGSHVEAGFVMGELLRTQEQFDLAANFYRGILREKPDFSDAPTY